MTEAELEFEISGSNLGSMGHATTREESTFTRKTVRNGVKSLISH